MKKNILYPYRLFFIITLFLGTLQAVEPKYEAPPNRPGKSGPLKIYCARTSYSNEKNPEISRHSEESIRLMIQQLNRFFQIQSYGKVWIGKADISPVIRLGSSELYEREQMIEGELVKNTNRLPLPETVEALCKEKLNINLRKDYDITLFFLNENPSGGEIKEGAGAYATWDGQAVVFLLAKPSWRSAAHEIGHNFSFSHAYALISNDPNEIIPTIEKRHFYEYGDKIFSPMGRAKNSYSIVEKYKKGWVDNRPGAERSIAMAKFGINSLKAYDQNEAKGVVGLYLEDDFGVKLSELNEIKAKFKNESKNEKSNQRLWFSLITKEDFDGESMKDRQSPLLILHLSNLSGSEKHDKAAMTVLLDTKPSSVATKRDKAEIKDTGIAVGSSATLRLASGKRMTIEFKSYSPANHEAVIEIKKID